MTPRTWVHCGDQHEVGRERRGALGPAYGDDFIFDRLPQYFERRMPELGEFIEKQNTPVTQRDLARSRVHATADQTRI